MIHQLSPLHMHPHPESVQSRTSSKRRRVSVGTTAIGGSEPVRVQSMCATRTSDIRATLEQIRLLERAGADLIRIAVDSKKDVEALKEIRKETAANLVVDLQENYRLARDLAPFVQKFRYNPGHLHHHQKNIPVEDKVKFLVDTAGEHGTAIRIGVNFGSIDPAKRDSHNTPLEAALNSALEHVEMVERFGFERFVVSLKSSHPKSVVEINTRFSKLRSDIPLHLGVTEAGLLPESETKTRLAVEQLLANDIGDTLRVSLTLPNQEKDKEIIIARKIIADVSAGRFISVPEFDEKRLNVISCPSCSRVENLQFVKLAEEVKRVTSYAKDYDLTIAVMGCRVNGPGETDEADLGLWCAANFVNLKRGEEAIGSYPYDQVIGVLLSEVDALIEARKTSNS